MGHDHHHHHHASGSAISRKLVISTCATALFVVFELIIGFRANSLALIGDAFHNFTDALALVIALVAVHLERRPATAEKSFGYQRAGILAAFINASTLVALTIFLFIEAVDRFRNPHPVDSVLMIVASIVGMVVNLGITFALRREGREDVNIRSAVIHLIGDAVSSAGVIVAAVIIRYTGSPQWDPAVSVIIGVLILWSSWGILRETMNLLLEGVPADIDPEAVTRSIGEVEGVLGVHHLHIWAIGHARPALSCHLLVDDVPVRSTGRLLDQVNEMLTRDYRIGHTTIQFEFAHCPVDDPYCVPYSPH